MPAMSEPTPYLLHRVFDYYRPALNNLSVAIEGTSQSHARLLYEALARCEAELRALSQMPQGHAEAAVAALRAQDATHA